MAVVTGASRRAAIGVAVARRLVADGAAVLLHSWVAHDEQQPWGADPLGPAAVVDELRGQGGRVVLFSSGQYRGAMPGELPYVASKGALHQLTPSLAAHLMPRGITVNCVDPGPNDTGYADTHLKATVAARSPGGRWGTPSDTARLVGWLVSDEADWVTGQVIASDGGWSARS